MPLDVGRVTHLIEQMHRSEDDAGDPIDADKVLVTDGARGFTWEDYGASSGGGGGFDVTPGLSNALPPWVKPSGTGVITPDPQGRITLDSDTTYKAFPGVTFLEGRLHLVYRQGTAHNNNGGVIRYRTSDDLGRTWSSATTIFTPTSGDDLRDPNIVALASGRLLLNYLVRSPWNSLNITTVTRYSDDRGQTWSGAYTIPDTLGGTESDATSPAIELPDGTVVLPGYGAPSSLYRCWVWFSTDGGATFPTQTLVAQDGTASFNETTVRYLASGELVALIRDETSGHVYRSVSTDLGATWSAEADVLSTTAGRPDFVEIWPGVLFFMGRGASGQSVWAVSWDKGATWTALQDTDSGVTDDAMYHALQVLAPGYVLAVYGIENSSSDSDLYVRYFRDGFGIDPLGNANLETITLGGIEVDLTDPDDDEVLTYSGGSLILAPASGGGGGVPNAVLLESGHAVPFTFDEILQASDGSDFLWASE